VDDNQGRLHDRLPRPCGKVDASHPEPASVQAAGPDPGTEPRAQTICALVTKEITFDDLEDHLPVQKVGMHRNRVAGQIMFDEADAFRVDIGVFQQRGAGPCGVVLKMSGRCQAVFSTRGTA
jgi:hypothetical protein